ncbi:MAG: hypothetical protein R3F13_19345 [Prosthecobacter sp.]
MKWMRWFFREWGMRLIQRFGMLIVLGPLIFFVLHAAEDRIDTVGEWLWALVAVLLPLVLGKWLWDLHDIVDVEQPPPSPAEERGLRLTTVADSVNDLPGGISFQELCDQLDEKQMRKLLHLLHQIRPGERHLRDVVSKL